jgi:hypothetical protein
MRNLEKFTFKKDLTKVQLTNFDLPRIVNGRQQDPDERRPFSRAFSKEKVHAANAKVGAVPLTRAALLNPRVRKELGPADEPGGVAKRIADAHAEHLVLGQELGLQTEAMEISLPKRFEQLVAPPTAEEEVISKLVEGRCSAGSIWVNCGAVAFNSAVVNKAGCTILENELALKADKASGKLALFTELKGVAETILTRMRDEQTMCYDDLAAGEPKSLLRFYFNAKNLTGIAKHASILSQIEFLDGLPEETFEELLMLDVPEGYVAPAAAESAAQKMLQKMSDSTRRTIELASTSEREVILSITGKAGAADGVDEAQSHRTIDAASAGFDSDVLVGETLLETLPPLEAILTFGSEHAKVLKGREIMYNFGEGVGWHRGLILKPAHDATVKQKKRICNFRVFFESDDELLNQPLYAQTYAAGAAGAADTWMLIATDTPKAPLGVGSWAARHLLAWLQAHLCEVCVKQAPWRCRGVTYTATP